MCDRSLVKDFWQCGDNEVIEFAIHKARLNRLEKEVLCNLLDECLTQEETAEAMDISTRKVQNLWYSASEKLLSIPWVIAYSKELSKEKGEA